MDFEGVAKRVGKVVQQFGEGLSDTDGCENVRAKERVAAETIVENVLGPGTVGVYPGEVRELLEGEGGDGTFVTFANPLEREVVAVGVEGVWRREGIAPTFSETPEETVGFKIEGSAFPVSVRPSFRPPGDVQTSDWRQCAGWCENGLAA